jgi:hypothetical protein
MLSGACIVTKITAVSQSSDNFAALFYVRLPDSGYHAGIADEAYLCRVLLDRGQFGFDLRLLVRRNQFG